MRSSRSSSALSRWAFPRPNQAATRLRKPSQASVPVSVITAVPPDMASAVSASDSIPQPPLSATVTPTVPRGGHRAQADIQAAAQVSEDK